MSDIFVFGSNLAGRHGKGAARVARREYGALYGVGEGPIGRAYAIPTKDFHLVRRSLDEIYLSIRNFVAYAHYRDDQTFLITSVGCGLAGYTFEQIAPLFGIVPSNCRFFDPTFAQLARRG